jgi:hypothetical protein
MIIFKDLIDMSELVAEARMGPVDFVGSGTWVGQVRRVVDHNFYFLTYCFNGMVPRHFMARTDGSDIGLNGVDDTIELKDFKFRTSGQMAAMMRREALRKTQGLNKVLAKLAEEIT